LDTCKNLRIISRYGVGCDAIDLEAARAKGIQVAYTPGANSNAVADLTLGLMLAAARHVPYMDSMIRKGTQERPIGLELWRKTLGLIGTGRVGKAVMKRASGFEMRLLCYDIHEDTQGLAALGAAYTDLDTLYSQSDVISLHVPLTGETRGMIAGREFNKMKKTGILINTARGGLIDENALYQALKTGAIFAAGLDVTLEEPPYASPLCTLPNCILSPHIGASTVEATHAMGMMAVENLLQVLRTGSCPYVL
jgi:D-3-phosphoglycerate dehydrogenase